MTRQTDMPCPACGRRVEVERIEVTTWADGPDNPQYIDGRASCPSGCDPRFRRIVVAPDHRAFVLVCRDFGWNPNRVIYLNAADRSRAVQSLRGMAIRPDMVTMLTEPHPEIWAALRYGINRGDAHDLPFPPVPRSSERSLPWSGLMVEANNNPAPYIVDPDLWDAATADDEPVIDFSPERMARAIDEAITHNARILERHRTEQDPFTWGDSMRSAPDQEVRQ